MSDKIIGKIVKAKSRPFYGQNKFGDYYFLIKVEFIYQGSKYIAERTIAVRVAEHESGNAGFLIGKEIGVTILSDVRHVKIDDILSD